MSKGKREVRVDEIGLNLRQWILIIFFAALMFAYVLFRQDIYGALSLSQRTIDFVFFVFGVFFLSVSAYVFRTREKKYEYVSPYPNALRIFALAVLILGAVYWLNAERLADFVGIRVRYLDAIAFTFFILSYFVMMKFVPPVLESGEHDDGNPPEDSI